MVFIAIIVGLAFFQLISNQVAGVTQLQDIDNESLDISAARIGDSNNIDSSYGFALSEPYVESISEIRLDNTTALNSGTDYVLTDSKVYFQNTTDLIGYASNDTFVDFKGAGSDYLTTQSSRSLTALIPLFFVIAILGAAMLGIFGDDAKRWMRDMFNK